MDGANLKPFLNFYGSKWRIAPKYPRPKYLTLIEPFAGAAGYSIRHYNLNVNLYDVDPIIVGVWDYLIKASPKEIRELPADVLSVRDINVCQEAKWLIGFWLVRGRSSPGLSLSKWGRNEKWRSLFWGEKIRERIATQVPYIKHWKVYHKSYDRISNRLATWFIDPPYLDGGEHYTHSNIDYGHLGSWCKERKGMAIVCERYGADWLEFKEFERTHSTLSDKSYMEAVWVNSND